MRDHSNHVELDRKDAVAALLDCCNFEPSEEEVPLEAAYGRVLAADALALVTMPNCLTCNMDSIALRWSDFEDLEQGEVPEIAGWERGVQWEFANTGVGMPEGFDCAIAIENAVVSADDAVLEKIVLPPSRRFAGTSPAGSRFCEGDLVARRGSTVTPLVAAALASAGHTSARVVARPRVAFIPTGNELVEAGKTVPRGKNIESNSLLVRGKVEAWGGEARVWPIVADDPCAIEAAIREACASCDVVVLNAGSSKGSDDYAMELLERIGRVLYHETSHGPGHHSSGSVVDGTPVVGISGPPLGAAFTTDFYVKPLIERWYGRATDPQTVTVRLSAGFGSTGQTGGPGRVREGVPSAPGGEARPSVERSRPFYSIQHLVFSQAPDGVIEATPLPARPSLTLADTCHGYYALNRQDPQGVPKAGDLVDVELRG